jgi:threonine dehydrogenase-like Zn-dependent dehydrogenase
VDPTWAGRTVFSFTGHRSAGVVAVADLVPLPPDLAPEDGVFLAAMETALSLVQDAAPRAGETLGVWGLGTVGTLTAAIGSGGPFEVFGWDAREGRRQWARGFGIQVPEAPKVCDVAIEVSGHPAALAQALAQTRFGGKVVVGSWYGSQNVEAPLGGAYHRSRVTLVPSQVSTVAPELSGRWTKVRRLAAALELVERRNPSGLITHRFSLGQAEEAYRLACDLPDSAGQILFTYP